MRGIATVFASFGLLVAFGCGGDDSSDVDARTGDGGGSADGGSDAAPAGCVPDTVPCLDDVILDLSLHDDKVSTGTVTNTADGSGWLSEVDATAGGMNEAANNPFIYLKFDETGLVKVDIDDETALESKDWDIAARRYVVRLNGGNSGPACVGAQPRGETTYPLLGSVPLDAVYSYDDFYTAPPTCEWIADGSGLPGSPDVALATWWGYDGCVTTTETPFIIELDNGRVVKLVVEAYYGTGQESCNNTGSPGSDSGMLTFRWAFLS